MFNIQTLASLYRIIADFDGICAENTASVKLGGSQQLQLPREFSVTVEKYKTTT